MSEGADKWERRDVSLICISDNHGNCASAFLSPCFEDVFICRTCFSTWCMFKIKHLSEEVQEVLLTFKLCQSSGIWISYFSFFGLKQKVKMFFELSEEWMKSCNFLPPPCKDKNRVGETEPIHLENLPAFSMFSQPNFFNIGYPFLQEAAPIYAPWGVFSPLEPINVNPTSIYSGSEGRSCPLL